MQFEDESGFPVKSFLDYYIRVCVPTTITGSLKNKLYIIRSICNTFIGVGGRG